MRCCNALTVNLRRPALLLWLTLLLFCAALTAAQASLRRQKRHAEAIEKDYQTRLDEVYRAVIPFCDRPAVQVAAGLNGGRPLEGQTGEEARPVNTFAGTVLDDSRTIPAGVSPFSPAVSFRAALPATTISPQLRGWVVYLHFIDDRLRGAYVITPPHPVYPRPSAGWIAMQWALGGLFCCGAGVWCLCGVLLPFNRPWRRQIAHVSLAGLLVAALAQRLGPGWTLLPLSPVGILHTPLLAAVVLAALLSVISLIIAPGRPSPQKICPLCTHCGYVLTGNLSGICPECGHYTRQGLIDRWRDEADRVARIGLEESSKDDSWEEVTNSDQDPSPAPRSEERSNGEPDEKTDNKRPPQRAAWVSAECAVPAPSYPRPEQSGPRVQAPAGVSTCISACAQSNGATSVHSCDE